MKIKIKSYNGELSKYLSTEVVYEAQQSVYLGHTISTDYGDVYIYLKGCPHLNGGDWEIIEEDNT